MDEIDSQVAGFACHVLMGSATSGEAVDVAVGLVMAGVDDEATVAVAARPRSTAWHEMESDVRGMLSRHGFVIDEDEYVARLRAFAWWSLPLAHVERLFYERLPSWEDQDELERRMVLGLDARDHLTTPGEKDALEESLRDLVRTAVPPA